MELYPLQISFFIRILETYSDKDSSMEQELAYCHSVYDIATYKKMKVSVTKKITV